MISYDNCRLILSRNNASGRSSQTELTPVETNRLINMLKPYFNNSIYTVMQLVDGMGRKVRRMNNTSRTTNTRNCGSDYCFDYFNFVLNNSFVVCNKAPLASSRTDITMNFSFCILFVKKNWIFLLMKSLFFVGDP